MSDLVKTGNEIQVFLNLLWKDDGLENKLYDEESAKKYLVLPSCLDELERMLKEEIVKPSYKPCLECWFWVFVSLSLGE